jgi:LCP family protein required for cell wall assembly
VDGEGPVRSHWQHSRGFSAFDDEITEVHHDLTAEAETTALPAVARSRGARRTRRWGVATGYTVLALVSMLVLGGTGYAWSTYHSFNASLNRSDALDGSVPKSNNGDTNILIMGLDSRLDENGNALPDAMYQALHAGDSTDGGQNANVLMLLHVPGDGSRATAISIPRDDYISFAGCPYNQCKGKIKQAYGLAYEQTMEALYKQGVHGATQVQQAREAARKEEAATVSQFLGGVPIDHFVEVTLAGFFEIAQVVQPITVCLNENTSDPHYSGASFHSGYNNLSAAQAVAFVRQRRDPDNPTFTDLDRERRQQAFISALAYKLKQAGELTDPTKLSAILDVAQANIAVDANLDLLTFAGQASNLTGGNITFYTLPIAGYGGPTTDTWNVVNVPLIQSTVHNLLYPGGSGAAPSASTTAAPTTAATTAPTSAGASSNTVVDVQNASGAGGMAAKVEAALSGNGFIQGRQSTASSRKHTTIVYYGPGASDAAKQIAGMLGDYSTESDSAVDAHTVKVVLGSDFSMPSGLSGATAATTSVPPASAVSGTGPGTAAPNTDQLSAISGGGIPCVK